MVCRMDATSCPRCTAGTQPEILACPKGKPWICLTTQSLVHLGCACRAGCKMKAREGWLRSEVCSLGFFLSVSSDKNVLSGGPRAGSPPRDHREAEHGGSDAPHGEAALSICWECKLQPHRAGQPSWVSAHWKRDWGKPRPKSHWRC